MHLTQRQFTALPKARARQQHKPGHMNTYERQYSEILDAQKTAGEITAYWFERFTLKLADDCRYTPDFLVQLPDGTLEMREVKGYWREDALIKIKVAAEMFPLFGFVAIERLPKKAGGGWKQRDFNAIESRKEHNNGE